MQDALLQQGLDITIFGMSVVFGFLLLLVIGTSIMSRFVTRFFPESAPVATPAEKPAPVGDARLHAVIKAAIEQHRQRNHRR